MKLLIKRDVSASNSEFTIYDELGNLKYYVEFIKQKTKSKASILVTDAEHSVKAKIRQLPLVGTNTFVFKVGKSHITFVVVPTSKGIYSYFYGNNWHIHGEIITGKFSIIDVDNSVIASQQKCGGYCELNITDEANELYCLSASVCTSLINTVDRLTVQTV